MICNYFGTDKNVADSVGFRQSNLLANNLAANVSSGSTVHVTNYGSAHANELLDYAGRHVQSLGENTIHVCLLVWSGNYFTSSTDKTKAGVRKARRLIDRLITATQRTGCVRCSNGLTDPGLPDTWP